MRIGIDLGGTKIEAIALDHQGIELFRQRANTPQHDYSATLQCIVDLVDTTEAHTHQTGNVGIGIPGAMSPASGKVKNANSTWLIGQPLKPDLEKMLGREVRIANDANCFVTSEATDGAASDASVVFGVIIGTGTGGGIAINKQAITGMNAIAGEWGHNPLPWPEQSELPGPDCYCGKQGCIETFVSGPGLSHDYQHHANKKLSAVEITHLAKQGDKLAEQALQRYEHRLAKSLAHVINILDPDVIVLGGGMSNLQRLYTNIPKHWSAFVFSDKVATRLVAPIHGDSSGVRGAAWLWPLD